MATVAAGGEQEESGPLVFQRGKKLNDAYYIVSVRDNAEGACVKFSAYELESSETYELSYSYTDFDALFKDQPDLANPANKEGRYDWAIDRLDFTTDSGAGAKRLVLASEPTAEDDGPDSKTGAVTKAVPKDRLTFAERARLRAEADKLEEKRSANIALKSEKNRKAFVAELQEKRRLEELKSAARRQRIDEERAETREKAEMSRRIAEERKKRYELNDKKREEKIAALMEERKARDLTAVRDIVRAAKEKKQALEQKLEEARQRKMTEQAHRNQEALVRKASDAKLERKREEKIAERNERLKQAEIEYLDLRAKQIEQIKKENLDKEDRKKEWLREKAAERATALSKKHAQIEAWERAEDTRTQANLKREHARDMLMLDHIEGLRQKLSREQAEADARKQASLEQRQEREAREAEENNERLRQKSELEQKRNREIAKREAMREQANTKYCEYIRDLKTSEEMRIRDQQNIVISARQRFREQRTEERKAKADQENSAAIVNSLREESIRKRERERDQKFAAQLKQDREREKERLLEMESRKLQKRLQEKEAAIKTHEQESAKRAAQAKLEEQRDKMIQERAQERNRREQERLKTVPKTPSGDADKDKVASAELAAQVAGEEATVE